MPSSSNPINDPDRIRIPDDQGDAAGRPKPGQGWGVGSGTWGGSRRGSGTSSGSSSGGSGGNSGGSGRGPSGSSDATSGPHRPGWQRWGRRILIGLAWIVGVVLGLVILLVVALQVPAVQTFAARQGASWLEDKVGTRVAIDRVSIRLFKKIRIEGLYLEDERGDTLLYTRALQVDIGVFALTGRRVLVDELLVEGLRVGLHKPEGRDRFNFQHIVDAFASDTTAVEEPADTSSGSWEIDAHRLRLHDIRFTLDDRFARQEAGLILDTLALNFHTLGLDSQHVRLEDGRIAGLAMRYLQSYEAGKEIRDTVEEKAEKIADPTDPEPLNASGWKVDLGRLALSRISGRYKADGAPAVANGRFNPQDIDVHNLALVLERVHVGANDVRAQLAHLSLRERRSGAALDELRLAVNITHPRYRIELAELRTPGSRLASGVAVDIRDLGDTARLIADLRARGRVDGDSITMAEIARFVPALDSVGTLASRVIHLDGGFELADYTLLLDSLAVRDGAARVGVHGRIRAFDDVTQMKMDRLAHQAILPPYYLDRLLGIEMTTPELAALGTVHAAGEVSGTLAQGLEGNLRLDTRAGSLDAPLYRYRTDPATFARHEGEVVLVGRGLEPRIVLGPDVDLRGVSFRADVAGGFSEAAGPRLDRGLVVVERARYNGYTYRNARLRGRYVNNVGQGRLTFIDSNARVDVTARADMRPKKPIIEVYTHQMLSANLRAMNLTEDTLAVSADTLSARIVGLDPAEMEASLEAGGLVVQQKTRRAALDSLVARVGFIADSGYRFVDVRSEVLKLRMAGAYDLEHVGPSLTNHIAQYIPLTALEKTPNVPDQQFRLDVHIPAGPEALEALVDGLLIPAPITAHVTFDSRADQLDSDIKIGDVRMGDNQLTGARLTTQSTPGGRAWDINFRADLINADSFLIPEPELDFRIREGDARFQLRIASDEADSRARLAGQIEALGERNAVTLSESALYLKGHTWELDERARFEYHADGKLRVDDFRLVADDSAMVMIQTPEGFQYNALEVRVANLQLADIVRLVPAELPALGGVINLKARTDDVFEARNLVAELTVDSLEINEKRAGKLTLTADQPAPMQVGLDARLANLGNEVHLTGRYHLEDTANALDFRLRMDNFQPEEIAPLLADVVNRFEGDLTADMTIKGRVANPIIRGELAFNGRNIIEPAFTRVPLELVDQRLLFDGKGLSLNQFTVRDEQGQPLIIDGRVGLEELTAPNLNLTIRADKFHLLNTRTIHSGSFFGQAFVTTDLNVRGPAEALRVQGVVQTDPGTDLTYNLDSGDPAEISRANFITFVDSRDSSTFITRDERKHADHVNVEGLGLTMNIRLTPESRFTIVIDQSTGDQVQVQGTSDLEFTLNPNGVVRLQGDYTIQQGFYSLNLLGLARRRFTVEEGSTLQWRGDPANAAVGLTAVYTTRASRYELIADQVEAMSPAEAEGARRRQPVDVLLKIGGTLQAPSVSFDLRTPEESGQMMGSGASQIVVDQLTRIRQDESELNKQALGLIAFNRFVTTGQSQGTAGSTTGEAINDNVNQTVSDVLSRQLSNLSQDYLGGVEIEVDVNQNQMGGADQTGLDADRQVGVSMSRSLFNERLRVSVGGLVNTNNSAQAGAGTPMLGDITAQYRLDRRGNFFGKFFRSYNQNIYTSSNHERLGVSLQHTTNFSSFRSVFWTRERRERERSEERARLQSMREQTNRE